ncbi:MAG: flippase-like domain-containing protein, partial [Desulfobacteraceae bacterium]|nr:flippase-like domain-containing protein [Desulfobacteraceae bacterium]
MRKAVQLTVLLACGFFLFSYARDHFSDFEKIRGFSPWYATLAAMAYVVTLVLNGYLLKALTVGFGIHLRFAEHFSISVVTSFGNLFLPMKGGAGLRAVYLKERYDFDYAYFLSSLAGTYLIAFNINALAGLAGLAVLRLNGGSFHIPAAAVFAAIFAGTFWAIIAPPASLPFIPVRWLRLRLEQVLEGWRIMRRSGKTVLSMCVLVVLNLLLTSWITWLEFSAFDMKDLDGLDIGMLQAIVLTVVGVLSFLVSITPAGLGIREGFLMLSAELVRISPAHALTVSLLDRAINF